MAHYSIYLPGATGSSKSLLERVHLADLQVRQGWSWYPVPDGPDGKGGVIGTVLSGDDDSRPVMNYDSNIQKWVPVGNRPDLEMEKGAFWYGYEPERPPEPRDLLHDRIVVGKHVRLMDGNVWHIPESLKLPMDVGRDPETGELTKIYGADFERFCKMAEKYVFIFFENIINLEMFKEMHPEMDPGEIHEEFSMDDSWEYCSTALAINYRVAEPIIGPGMLHLFDDRRMAYVIMATLAFPDIVEVIEKKKTHSHVTIPVGLTMSPGELTQPQDHQRGSTSTS